MERMSTRSDSLDEETKALRELVACYYHHLRVRRVLYDDNIIEIAAWFLRGEALQRDAEQLLPQLK